MEEDTTDSATGAIEAGSMMSGLNIPPMSSMSFTDALASCSRFLRVYVTIRFISDISPMLSISFVKDKRFALSKSTLRREKSAIFAKSD
jgi:hypothetical protein